MLKSTKEYILESHTATTPEEKCPQAKPAKNLNESGQIKRGNFSKIKE